MAKKNSIPLRSDVEFQKIIQQVMAENLARKGKLIKTPRITLAIARQYKKYPQLLKELKEAELI